MQAEKSIVHQAAAGLIGIALPPNAAIENPPNFIDIILNFVTQKISNDSAGGLILSSQGPLPAYAEILQKSGGLFQGIGWFHIYHGLCITQNFLQIWKISFLKAPHHHAFRLKTHYHTLLSVQEGLPRKNIQLQQSCQHRLMQQIEKQRLPATPG